MKRLFGTDGIRGRANRYPITAEMALCVGKAVGRFFSSSGKRWIIVGKDTRISSDMLEYALAAGICSSGSDSLLIGVMPTPGVAFLTRKTEAAAGIMISASHNPYHDNGIKIFDSDGSKLPDSLEIELERLILSIHQDAEKNPMEPGKIIHSSTAEDEYAGFFLDKFSKENERPFSGLKIVLDCSNGATCRIAPRVFSELGADVISLFNEPDGININHGCGSQNTDELSKEVIRQSAHAGLAFDGDGDRLIAVDEKGNRVTGDVILLILAKEFKKRGALLNDTVVSTVMSNLGFRLALKEMGIRHVEADVGDRYVLEAMKANHANIGGEDSGHIILSDHQTTGDGILTALFLLSSMVSSKKSLKELAGCMSIYPQKLVNIEVTEKPDLNNIPEIVEAVKKAENNLGDRGRVLLRYSGTRPVLRIMVESTSREKTDYFCEYLKDVAEKALGKMI